MHNVHIDEVGYLAACTETDLLLKTFRTHWQFDHNAPDWQAIVGMDIYRMESLVYGLIKFPTIEVEVRWGADWMQRDSWCHMMARIAGGAALPLATVMRG